jgi:hypothetical protein
MVCMILIFFSWCYLLILVTLFNFTIPVSLLQPVDVFCFQALVECLFSTQLLRIPQSKVSTKLVLSYLKKEAEPASEMSCFKVS